MLSNQNMAIRPQILKRRAWLDEALVAVDSLIMGALDSPVNIHHKGRIDLVTETDMAVEAFLVDGIGARFSQDNILAEESGSRVSEGAFRWIIDPIDGTTNFSNRLPHFCVSVALQYEGELVMCSVYDPVKRHHFRAERGFGASLNDIPIRVSQTSELLNGVLGTGFSYDRHQRPDNNVSEFDYMLRRCRGLRRMGAAALDFAYVAAGWLDGYWEYRLKPWDAAAGILLVEEAGGTVTDILGSSFSVESEHFCVTNGHLHTELVESISRADDVIGTGLPILGETQ